ncbi:phosphotransferase [Mesomycoplasma lagogenitalium]|uniref:Phosphotransferase n=1 Tax=Mesomycoplasma lagogenitalium TaxID=171286 RepID=A0ABY8LTX9_9BACT|nr:phosphotransferase [Mesomycoplasma lagogenitalium]WGI36700.1 phosphotransferase [Mesomycoplasma lagogenitalium]
MKFSFIPKKFLKNIKNIKIFYSGKQNKTYIGDYQNIKVQIRVPNINNDFVNWKNEKEVIKCNSDFLYYKNGVFIKKWIEASTLKKINLNQEIITKIFQEIENFSLLPLTKIKKFDWKTKEINDLKYRKLVRKYKNDQLFVSHGDLRKKNILFTNKNEIYLIDFEWTRLNNKYFDLVCLNLYLKISKKLIIDYFKLDKQKFNDFAYMIKKFNNHWIKKHYNGKI